MTAYHGHTTKGYSDEWRDSFVLACGASPANAAALQLAQEFTVTKKAIREVSNVYSFWHDTERAFIDRDWSTVNSLADDLVKYRPLVLHISSHASEFAVNLAGDSANSEHSQLSLEMLRNLVTTSRQSSIPYPEVIVLNCCYTETMAIELANIRTPWSPNNGPFVIGTKLPKLGDNQAVAFAEKFYRSLAEGSNLGDAFGSAQGTSDIAGMYFLDTGGRVSGDMDVASNYYVPPSDYRISPFATGYMMQRELYRTLANTARQPLAFGRYDFEGRTTRNVIDVSGIEFELVKLPRVGSREISGFYGETDRLLEQDPKPSVPGSENYARYFVNHLRAITGDRSHGPCFFAWYQGAVYYEDQGAWLRYGTADNFRWLNGGMDPVRWKERFPFEW